MLDTSWMVEGIRVPDNFKIDHKHPYYMSLIDLWAKCRDAREGSHSVKERGERYLPRLQSQKDSANIYRDEDYKEYKERAIWYGATGQTVNSFVGMIFRKDPIINGYKDLLQFEATDSGETFLNLMKVVTDDIFTVGRVGILEDFNGSTDGMSIAQAERANLKSTTTIYPAESIINWGHDEYGRLDFVVLCESYIDTDGIESSSGTRYRLLTIDEHGYKQVVISNRKALNGSIEKYVGSITYPMIGGSTFDYIPFWCATPYGDNINDARVPFIADLVELNLGHYRNSADHENEMHYVSIKTAVFPGWNAESMGVPRIGGSIACPPDQKPFVLESSGTSALSEEMSKKEQRMATLGSQLLAQGGRYIQSADTSNNNSQGEESILQQVASSLDQIFADVGSLKSQWSNLGGDVTVTTNKDYFADNIPNDKLTALVQAYQTGAISFDTFFYNMEKIEMYPEEWTVDIERGLIETVETHEPMMEEPKIEEPEEVTDAGE